jgi:hypothetical protein
LKDIIDSKETVLDMRGISVDERERVLEILEKMYNIGGEE